MTDGHWTIGEALAGAPKANAGIGHKTVTFKKTRYRHFQTVVATTSYVEGEFPWQIQVGDQATAHEYVAPPRSISIEETQLEGGQDIAFTGLHHIDPSTVWKAFELPGSPPSTSGVGSNQPNPWKKGRAVTWVSFAALLGLWVVVAFIYINGRHPEVVFEDKGIDLDALRSKEAQPPGKASTAFEPITREVEIGEPGQETDLELDFEAYPLSNAWAYVDVMLISQESEKAIGFGATAEEWHGVSGGESWREGDDHPTAVVGGVPGGKYLLQIVPSAGGQATNSPAPTGLKLNVRLREDIVLLRYLLVPLAVIVFFPLVFMLLSLAFESRRWANSDYASSS